MACLSAPVKFTGQLWRAAYHVERQRPFRAKVQRLIVVCRAVARKRVAVAANSCEPNQPDCVIEVTEGSNGMVPHGAMKLKAVIPDTPCSVHEGEESPERLVLIGLMPKLNAHPALVRYDCVAIKGMTAASVPAHSETSTQTKFKAAVCARHRFGENAAARIPKRLS